MKKMIRIPGVRTRPAVLGLYLAVAAWTALAFAQPGTATVTFADVVAERNLSPTGYQTVRFPEGSDSLNLFSGTLAYDIPLGSAYPMGGKLGSYGFQLRYTSSIWDFDTGGSGVVAHPGRFNAGLGWKLSFGELLAPGTPANPSNFWIYVSPAGRRSRFYSTLEDGETATPGVFYTRGSTYLRLRVEGTTASVELPGGVVKEFTPAGTDWRLTRSRDVFGNQYSVDYTSSTLWTITDSHGRTHRIYWIPDPNGTFGSLIDRIELAAFGGQTATWNLSYGTANVGKPRQDTEAGGTVVPLSVLTRVEAPDGSAHVANYYWNASLTQSGRLRDMTLPTGGFIKWWYAESAFPYLAGAEHAADVVGVTTRRTKISPAASTWRSKWSISRALDLPRTAGAVDQPRELRVTVTRPDGTQRATYFSVYVSGNALNDSGTASFSKGHYGLPFTVNQRTHGAYLLSSILYDSAGTAVRTDRLRYRTSPCSGCFDLEPRLDLRRTVYHDDGGHYVSVSYTGFDGLGHYATVTRSDKKPSTAPKNQSVTSYVGTRPTPDEPWILGLFTQRYSKDSALTFSAGAHGVSDSCSDPETGLVLRHRIRAATDAGPHDLVRTYEYDALGNLAVARYYGGDTQTLGTGDLCTLTLPAEEFASFEEHQYGTVRRKGWLDASGNVFVETYAATIDRNTGRVTTEHMGDEFVWVYAYDTLGRRTSATPPTGHGGRRSFSYSPAGAGGGAELVKTVRGPDGVTVLSSTRTTTDPFGNLERVSRQTSVGWADTVKTYDTMGRLASTTDPVGRVTETLAWDALGRPTRLRKPDGHEETFSHQGERVTRHTVSIGKRWNEAARTVVEVQRTTETVQNHLGRVIQTRIDDSDGTFRTETFTLDKTGQVVEVTATDGTRTVSVSRPNQTDGRGFVVQDGDGQPVGPYDSLGHLTEIDYGYGVILRTYDRAGRLRDRKEKANGRLWTRNFYATVSSGGNYAKGKPSQRLRVNRGVKHVPNEYVLVRELYTYSGDGGSLSEIRTTAVAGFGSSMPLHDFRASVTRDATGQRTTVTYPDCVASVTCTPLEPRQVHYDTDLGHLSAVTSTVGSRNEVWIYNVTYDPAGFATRRDLGNGLVQELVPHPAGGQRLQHLTLRNASGSAIYDSGDITYDGLGRMVQVGDQRHISDSAYALDLPEEPVDGGAPPFRSNENRDPLGKVVDREYGVPHPYQPGQYVHVLESYVYAPSNRLLWRRVLNCFDLRNYGISNDFWHLADVKGRTARTRLGYSRYQGIDPYCTTGDLTESRVTGGLEDGVDWIRPGAGLLGTSQAGTPSTRQKFLHHDVFGNLFATSDEDGEVLPNRTPLR